MLNRWSWQRAVFALTFFGISFGYVEAAIVVYLRHIYEPIRQQLHPAKPPGDLFPLITSDQLKAQGPSYERLLVIELGRELATLVMLGAAALAVASNGRQWLAGFVLSFGVWDLTFYAFLKMLIDWPASLMTWDILFLVPLPWVGPVLSPCIVAASMAIGGAVLLRRELSGGEPVRLAAGHWAALVLGALVLMIAWMWDWRNTMAGNQPNPFNWPLFALGEALSFGAFLHAAWVVRKAL
jgi:hypothetical protein